MTGERLEKPPPPFSFFPPHHQTAAAVHPAGVSERGINAHERMCQSSSHPIPRCCGCKRKWTKISVGEKKTNERNKKMRSNVKRLTVCVRTHHGNITHDWSWTHKLNFSRSASYCHPRLKHKRRRREKKTKPLRAERTRGELVGPRFMTLTKQQYRYSVIYFIPLIFFLFLLFFLSLLPFHSVVRDSSNTFSETSMAIKIYLAFIIIPFSSSS